MQLRPLENSDKRSYSDFARTILEGQNLESRFLSVSIDWTDWKDYNLPSLPGRSGKLSFSDQHMKFPKASRLNETEMKAMALHSFANHELLAIEMMAAAILLYPHQNEEETRFKKGLVTALKEEQKHLGLYIKRLNELGFEFGDFPLNDFFWRQMEKLKTPAQYTAVMSMTFEAANLDFAQYYARVFREMGDNETASILEIVLQDEIGHVAFGSYWMKKWRKEDSLWKYYQASLPWPLTPARSKGIAFDPSIHLKGTQDEDFVKSLIDFDDDFKITKRS